MDINGYKWIQYKHYLIGGSANSITENGREPGSHRSIFHWMLNGLNGVLSGDPHIQWWKMMENDGNDGGFYCNCYNCSLYAKPTSRWMRGRSQTGQVAHVDTSGLVIFVSVAHHDLAAVNQLGWARNNAREQDGCRSSFAHVPRYRRYLEKSYLADQPATIQPSRCRPRHHLCCRPCAVCNAHSHMPPLITAAHIEIQGTPFGNGHHITPIWSYNSPC